eukprot:SAG22_NODE_7159_length_770_cov_0.994039_2_plen_57_part_01
MPLVTLFNLPLIVDCAKILPGQKPVRTQRVADTLRDRLAGCEFVLVYFSALTPQCRR